MRGLRNKLREPKATDQVSWVYEVIWCNIRINSSDQGSKDQLHKDPSVLTWRGSEWGPLLAAGRNGNNIHHLIKLPKS